MDLEKAKRFSAFVYWIPAIIIVVGRVPIPQMLFVALPLPYYAVYYYLHQKTEESDRSRVEFVRLILVTISHFVLLYMMFYQ